MTASQPEPGYYERTRSTLARWQALIQARATGERVIAESYAQAVAEAEKEIQRLRKQISATRQKEESELAQTYETNVALIHGHATEAQTLAEADRRKRRKQMTDQYSSILQKLRAEYEDKRWTVESLREADTKTITQERDQKQREASAAAKQLEAHRTAGRALLHRFGIAASELEFPTSRLPAIVTADFSGKLQTGLEQCSQASARLGQSPWLTLCRAGGTAGLFLLSGLVGAGLTLPFLPSDYALGLTVAWCLVGGLFLRIMCGAIARKQTRDRARGLAVYLADVDRSLKLFQEQTRSTFEKQSQLIETTFQSNQRLTAQYYEPRIATMERQLKSVLEQIEQQTEARLEAAKKTRDEALAAEDARYTATANATHATLDARLAEGEMIYQQRMQAAQTHREESWAKLSQRWFEGNELVARVLAELQDQSQARFPGWAAWKDPARPLAKSVPAGILMGHWQVDQSSLPEGLSEDPRLALPMPIRGDWPAMMPFPDRAALLLRAADAGRTVAIEALQSLMLRFLTGLPPGKVRFTVIDPVGLGENFGSFMHLVDHDEQLMTGRIWTEPSAIEARLSDLTEHMENVIQKYLRNQYKSIEEYNQAAGEVAEPYRVLVVANFPVNFTLEAARRLVSIASSGPACGVCTLIAMDHKAALPRDFNLADLEQVACVFEQTDGAQFMPRESVFRPFPFVWDEVPSPDLIAQLAMRIGRAGREAGRVEVPFEFIMPSPGERWRGDATRGFEIPIGRAGATRRQLFRLGQGTAQHALVAGKTGSGKSTLLHALITNLALLYSPDEAELYLIDFKKGVEFKAYAEAQLPHARVIAIESEREFGVSVLQRLDGILRERGDRFRQAGVNDLAGYRAFLKQHHPAATCPRVLLIVDEFQEFFVEDDKLAQETGLLLDRLVRQGRAFGVHVLLGSQTLGGAYSLARSTIDQMAVRIALQCSEADAQLILSKDNTAARLLNRPGEAIYNDANGLTEGNDPFQVVWLPEERRQALLEDLRTRAIAAGRATAKPLVFEGNATANLWDNPILQAKLRQPETIPADRSPWQLFLGEPIAIQEPTQVTLRAQGGSHLLVLGSQEDTALSLWASLAISARVGRSAAAVHWLHATPDDSEYAPYLQQLVQALGLSATTYPAEQTLATLEQFTSACEARRNGQAPKTPQLLLLLGLHRLREIRKPEEDFGFGRKERAPSAGELLAKLLRDGPAVGLHVVAWCDSLPNLNRAIVLSTKTPIPGKVFLQMSATDSSQLIDTPAASRLGRHRALLIEEGTERPQKFRPYSLPAPSALPESFRLKLPEPPASPSDTPATELC